jgi:hypothetical protein
MNTTKSISGFLDINSEKYLNKKDNEPMPIELVDVKVGDKFTLELNVSIDSTDVNTNTGRVEIVRFYLDKLKSIHKDV